VLASALVHQVCELHSVKGADDGKTADDDGVVDQNLAANQHTNTTGRRDQYP